MKVARGIPFTIGVEIHESSKSAKAISSKMVRGVAGLSNMMRGDPKKPTFSFPGQRRNPIGTKQVIIF